MPRRIVTIWIALLVLALRAPSAEVRIWQTLIKDGTRREQTTSIDKYGPEQDADYALLKELPPLQMLASSDEPAERSITILPELPGQSLRGLGAALTDSAAFLLFRLKQENPTLYQWTMERLFDAETGAGFSILRRPVGSSDYTATPEYYTYEDKPGHFSIEHDKEYILPVLKDALKINPQLYLIGSPWSPPAWMKTNRDLRGISAKEKADGKQNRLRPDAFEFYADYLVKYLQAYAATDIEIDALTLQNEPQFDRAAYPCMRMTTEDQIRLISLLGPRLRAAGLNTVIHLHDHNWTLHRDDRTVIGGDTKQDPLELVSALLSNPELEPYLAGTAWHCYSGGVGDMKRVYRTLRKQFPDKEILCTEVSAWRDASQTDWFGDLNWGLRHNWLGGLAEGASAALQWNLALDTRFGPTLRDDSLAVGLVTIDSDTWNSVKLEREFYAMAQVSKAARLGSVRVQTKTWNSGGKILHAAFRHLDGSMALVVFNQNADDRSFRILCGKDAFVLTAPSRSITTATWDSSQ